MDFWRKLMSFPFFVMPRLLSSSSPIVESCTSFAVVQGITKTTKAYLYPLSKIKPKKNKYYFYTSEITKVFFFFIKQSKLSPLLSLFSFFFLHLKYFYFFISFCFLWILTLDPERLKRWIFFCFDWLGIEALREILRKRVKN